MFALLTRLGASAALLAPLLVGARRKELMTFTGGGPVRGNPCQAFHYHGFVGIEAQVVKRIADWIKMPRGITKQP